MTTRSDRSRLLLLTSALAALAVGCGGSDSNADEPVLDAALADGAPDTATTDGRDATPADTSDTSVVTGPWRDGVEVIGVGTAVGTGVLGPVYPMGLWASVDQVVVVGLARADFSWGGTTYPRGGFVLALDASTGAVRWHRQVGDSVGAITTVGEDLAIVGAFSRSISLPTTGAPIALTSKGLSDGVVAVLSKTGDFRWARRYGSAAFDQGFAITSDGDAVIVAGAITGTADLGEGCGSLQAQIGGDDGDGHPAGVQDAVVLKYGAGGACPWGAAIGAPLVDDMAFGLTAIDGAVYVTGEAARPVFLRTTSGAPDAELGGAASKRPAPFLLRLDPDGKRAPSAWFVAGASPGGRGRSVAHRGSDVLWAFTTHSTAQLTHDAFPAVELAQGGHVVTLRGEAVDRKSVV